MYCDKDNRGLFAIMDLRPEELETIHRALLAFRTGMVTTVPPTVPPSHSEARRQYDRAGVLLRQIEKTL